jgi:hypothetical protein
LEPGWRGSNDLQLLREIYRSVGDRPPLTTGIEPIHLICKDVPFENGNRNQETLGNSRVLADRGNATGEDACEQQLSR